MSFLSSVTHHSRGRGGLRGGLWYFPTPGLRFCGQALDAPEVLEAGGAGNKVLAVLRGDADATMLHLGTSLWDTCAPEAVLRAAGGALTDFFGARIHYGPAARVLNCYGVVATSAAFAARDARGRTHAGLCAAFRASGALDALIAPAGLLPEAPGQPQAADIARDLDGEPLTAAGLADGVGAPVAAYAAPEAGAFRGLMSEAVRLLLQPDGAAPPPPRSLFYKRVVMGDLPHTRAKAAAAPLKVARDVRSYGVEAAFLASDAAAALRAAGVPVVRAYAADLRPDVAAPLASRFALLLQVSRSLSLSLSLLCARVRAPSPFSHSPSLSVSPSLSFSLSLFLSLSLCLSLSAAAAAAGLCAGRRVGAAAAPRRRRGARGARRGRAPARLLLGRGRLLRRRCRRRGAAGGRLAAGGVLAARNAAAGAPRALAPRGRVGRAPRAPARPVRGGRAGGRRAGDARGATGPARSRVCGGRARGLRGAAPAPDPDPRRLQVREFLLPGGARGRGPSAGTGCGPATRDA